MEAHPLGGIAAVPPEVARVIREKLQGIRRDNAVAVPLAVESGRRAWGFPSPDSDFDCRFVFVRPLEHYLSPWTRRDVIELPLDGEYDVNGWELGKALKLMLKGNAVILEWLQSPIVYHLDADFRDDFLDLARRHADRDSIALHYLHLGERQWRTYFGGGEVEVPLKKVFYVLRPAAALRWMALHADSAVPPMNFGTLIEQSELPRDLLLYVSDLLARKAVTRELGQAPLSPKVTDFVTGEYASARTRLSAVRGRPKPGAQHDVESFFRRTVRRLSPD
jgi:uncharacterized protein